jgi:Tol biopolymer transport system component
MAQLHRILADPLFQNSNQLTSFLRFAVESTVTGNSRQLKEYVIGVEVLKRGDTFNPREDPCVRVVAGRVRSKLAEYYQGRGQTDPLRIDLPRGGYVPMFQRRLDSSPADLDRTADAAAPVGKALSSQLLDSGSRRLVTIGILGFLAAIGVSVSWLSSAIPRHMLRAVPLTSYPGMEVQPSVAPDGNHVAFAWSGEKQTNIDIYVQQIGSDKAVRLTSDPGRDFSPAWSPDGRTIAFARLLGSRYCGLFIIPAVGGTERKLLDTGAPWAQRPVPFSAWSPDGRWLAFSDPESLNPNELPPSQFSPIGSPTVSLYMFSIATGEKRRLTFAPPHIVGDAAPAFAPDGRSLAFVRTVTFGTSDLYLLPLSSDLMPNGEPQRLTSWNLGVNNPSWTPDGKEIVVASGPWENTALWRVAAKGTPAPRRLEIEDATVDDPTVSRQGKLVYARKSTDINIWRTELSNSGGNPRPPSRFLASTRIDMNPQYSPDGKHIAFASDRGGTREIWVCNEDGSNAIRLTSMNAFMTSNPRWSPDGARIVFESTLEGQYELYSVSSSGGPVKRLTNSPADEAFGVWSPDGHWIYFMSSRNGQRHVWKMPDAGGEAVQVTKHEGVVSFPSPDGEFLYYSERAGSGLQNGKGGLRRLRLNDGEDELVLPSVTFSNFAVARDGVYFIPIIDSEGGWTIHFLSLRTSKSTPILRLTGQVSEGLAVSPDGRSLLYTQLDEQKSDLMLINSFH